jgi:hypothetical protein
MSEFHQLKSKVKSKAFTMKLGPRGLSWSRLRSCAIPSTVIDSAHRQEFGLLRNRPDASLLLRARWIAQTRRRFGAANERRI